jgi:pyruvate dehydrogenase E2 component (dihydrolipoamide acetyltransferase)
MEEAVAVTLDKVIAGAKQVMAGHAPVTARARGISARASTAPAGEAGDAPKAPAEQPKPAAAAAPDSAPPAPEPSPAPAPAPAAAAAIVSGEQITMPHGDLTVTEATVIKWYKKVGEPVKKGETVVDVETDKAISYVESPIDGVLAQIVEAEGKVVKMGQLLGVIAPK